MSNILGIIASILIMPILIIGVGYFIYEIIRLIKDIIEVLKKDLFDGLVLIALMMGIIGFLLMAIAVCLI